MDLHTKHIADWEEFEGKNNFSIRQLAKDYLAELDRAPQPGSWHDNTPTVYGFEAFVSDNVSNYWNGSRGLSFGTGPFCAHYGIIVFSAKDFKSMRSEMYPNNYRHEKVMETYTHLMDKAEYMRSLGKISVMHDIDAVLRLYSDNSVEVYDLPPLPVANSADVDQFLKDALWQVANEHPAVTARLFNEASLKAGFSKHVKRNDVIDLIEKFLA